VTQRGNRRQKVFFCDADYQRYVTLLAESCRWAKVAVWAYCLMPNHVHLILIPRDSDGLRAALANAHRRYSREINFREGWRGYPWQGRFASFPMDDTYLMACARYVELNPVRARLVARARDWRWSSARAHLKGQDDGLVSVSPLLDRVDGWKSFLDESLDGAAREAIRASERTGRPLGDKSFVRKLEKKLGRTLAKRKPGPKPQRAAKQETLF
jgi:putative transposase